MTDHAQDQRLNFMADFAALDRQILVRTKPMSKFAAFVSGVLVATFVLFPVCLAFAYLLLNAALQEADVRAAKNALIGISQSDRNCAEWRMDGDSAWRCIRR